MHCILYSVQCSALKSFDMYHCKEMFKTVQYKEMFSARPAQLSWLLIRRRTHWELLCPAILPLFDEYWCPPNISCFVPFFDGNCFCNGSPLKAFICPISRTSYRNKSGAPLYWGILLPVCWVRMQSEFYFSSPVSCSCSTTLHCTRFCGWTPYRGWNTFNAPLS